LRTAFKGLLLAATLSLLSLPAFAQATIWVDDNTCPAPGDGSVGNPYCSIQDAYDAGAAPGDTIRVKPGTYRECVEAFGLTEDKPVDLVADDWLVNGNNTTTIIDGSLVSCSPISLVNVFGSDSRLEGFTIQNASGTGAVFAGGNVTITNNVIKDNVSTFGGGIYFYSAVCSYGNTTGNIVDNNITGNSAQFNGVEGGDAGGIYVLAVGRVQNLVPPVGDPLRCDLTGNSTVNITGNLIDNNDADGVFGAGLVAFTNTTPTQSATVTVSQNTITDNFFVNKTFGYGGGAWFTTYGYGTENIVVDNNTFASNVATADGGGLSAWIQTLEEAKHTIDVLDNSITGNTAVGNGGGVDAFVFVDDLFNSQLVDMNVSDNSVTGNTAAGDFGGGGGILASLFSERTRRENMLAMDFTVRGNRVTQNTARNSGGGISVLVSADADPDLDGGLVLDASARVDVESNRITGNFGQAGAGSLFSSVGGGMFIFSQAVGPATATTHVVLNTIAGNLADAGAGGIEIEEFSDRQVGGVDDGLNEIFVNSTIIANNDGFGAGGPPAGFAGVLQNGDGLRNLSFDVEFSDIAGNPDGAVEGSLPPPGALGFITADPMLDATAVPMECSPTIDGGDPAFDFDLEPVPRGDAINMGHTGGTATAQKSLADINGDGTVDGEDVLDLSTAFGTTSATQPRYLAGADFDGDANVDGDDLALLGADFGEECPQ